MGWSVTAEIIMIWTNVAGTNVIAAVGICPRCSQKVNSLVKIGSVKLEIFPIWPNVAMTYLVIRNLDVLKENLAWKAFKCDGNKNPKC